MVRVGVGAGGGDWTSMGDGGAQGVPLVALLPLPAHWPFSPPPHPTFHPAHYTPVPNFHTIATVPPPPPRCHAGNVISRVLDVASRGQSILCPQWWRTAAPQCPCCRQIEGVAGRQAVDSEGTGLCVCWFPTPCPRPTTSFDAHNPGSCMFHLRTLPSLYSSAGLDLAWACAWMLTPQSAR